MEPRTRTKSALNAQPGASLARVSVVQWAYRVDYGPGVRPRWHTVSKNRKCRCPFGAECPAVTAVGDYLRAGGERATDLPFDFWLRVPEACPICGAPAIPETALSSRTHGQGWRCGQTGLLCYWAARAVPLLMAQSARLCVTPLIGDANSDSGGKIQVVLQTTLETVRGWVAGPSTPNSHPRAVNAPGITASQIAEAWDDARARRAAWAAEGYFPDD